MKKLLSLLMCVFMLTGMFTFTALAEDAEPASEPVVEEVRNEEVSEPAQLEEPAPEEKEEPAEEPEVVEPEVVEPEVTVEPAPEEKAEVSDAAYAFIAAVAEIDPEEYAKLIEAKDPESKEFVEMYKYLNEDLYIAYACLNPVDQVAAADAFALLEEYIKAADDMIKAVKEEAEAGTEEAPAEDAEEAAPEEDAEADAEETAEPERKVSFTVEWDEYVVNLAHLTAVLEGYEGVEYTLRWQYSIDGEEWFDVEGATEPTYNVLTNEENADYFWRVAVTVVEEEAAEEDIEEAAEEATEEAAEEEQPEIEDVIVEEAAVEEEPQEAVEE